MAREKPGTPRTGAAVDFRSLHEARTPTVLFTAPTRTLPSTLAGLMLDTAQIVQWVMAYV